MNNENKRYLKLSAIYLAAIALIIFLLLKFGVAAAINISLLLQKRNSAPAITEPYQNIIQPPELIPILEATNSAFLLISGYSIPNQKVEIFINDNVVKTLDVNSEGRFEDFVPLSLGTSKIYSVALTSKEIRSSPSKVWTIFYNDTPPFLEILEPANNSVIKGRQNTVIIKGKVTPPAKAYVNDHLMILDNENTFNYSAVLQSGENKFKIVSLDPALNKTEMEWILNYQP